MVTAEEVQLIVSVSVTCLVLLLLICLGCTTCCIRAGLCGPRGLGSGDLRALKIFANLYRYVEVDIPDGYFDVEDFSKYCKLRKYTRSANPVKDWATLKRGAPKGFLVELAGRLERQILSWQYEMWNAKGDFAIYFPSFLVAQEWREWIMQKLQYIDHPDFQYQDMIHKRLRWISEAREVGRKEIVDLRFATGWDESDELSLLQVLRDIGRDLRYVHDRWHVYVHQQGFGRQADIITGFLVQFMRCGTKFMHALLNQDELCLGEDANSYAEGGACSTCCCFGASAWYANALDRQVRNWSDDIHLWEPTFPVAFLSQFLSEEKLSDMEADLAHVVDHAPSPSPFAQWNESIMSIDEKKLADDVLWGLNSDSFGLEEKDFKIMIQRSVTLLSELKCIAECALVLEILQTFSGLGGSLFLSKKVGGKHVMEVMDFVCKRVKSAENDVIAVGDKAQAGWSNLRRSGRETVWSNASPVDNARLGLRVRSDIQKIAADIIFYCQTVQSQSLLVADAEAKDVEEEIAREVALYERLWKIIAARFDKQSNKIHVHPASQWSAPEAAFLKGDLTIEALQV
mmetsp:Transcript_3207/g.7543  ORF Transcript_3207/g.7543 Transcript_3207/m.7543 type:complete len:571 (+) Transcript_3207:57-1769(+)